MTKTDQQHLRILRFLRELRDSHVYMAGVFTHGSCYHLYRIMRVVWPEAEACCLAEGEYGTHVLVRIGGRYYDINGAARLTIGQRAKLETDFERKRETRSWRNRKGERNRGFVTPLRIALNPNSVPIRLGCFVHRTKVRLLRSLMPWLERRRVARVRKAYYEEEAARRLGYDSPVENVSFQSKAEWMGRNGHRQRRKTA